MRRPARLTTWRGGERGGAEASSGGGHGRPLGGAGRRGGPLSSPNVQTPSPSGMRDRSCPPEDLPLHLRWALAAAAWRLVVRRPVLHWRKRAREGAAVAHRRANAAGGGVEESYGGGDVRMPATLAGGELRQGRRSPVVEGHRR